MDTVTKASDESFDRLMDAPIGARFANRKFAADGSTRASVALTDPRTLWFNTGTLCNIECQNCYIKSSPTNDSLVYITTSEVASFLTQIKERKWPISEIGLTGGEPFMNPDMPAIMKLILEGDYDLLVLTNAMRPMMRPHIRLQLLELNEKFCNQLTLRVSLDHFDEQKHDSLRGAGSYARSLQGMDWLRDNAFHMTVAARLCWDEDEDSVRAGFARLFAERAYAIDHDNPSTLVLFPEMDLQHDVPEITEACWAILGKKPDEMMCSSSRMVVKRKHASRPTVVSCTLLPYAEEFELGETLEEAEQSVYLNHPYCAQFCVLGQATCSP